MEFCRTISLYNRLDLAFCFFGMDIQFHKKIIIHSYKESRLNVHNTAKNCCERFRNARLAAMLEAARSLLAVENFSKNFA
jgi:hypothetical protein